MKKSLLKSGNAFFRALGIFLFAGGVFSLHAEITVIVQGGKNNTGKIMIAIYDKSNYLDKKKMAARAMVNAGELVTVKINDLKPGDYAVAVYHDENMNRKLDSNFLGKPQEGVGFSNNAKGFMGPPDFSASAFYYDGKKSVQKVKLEY